MDLDIQVFHEEHRLYTEPRSGDVQSGQGRWDRHQDHEGSSRYSELLKEYEEKFAQAETRKKKQAIVNHIIQEVQLEGRFLRFDRAKKKWFQMPDDEVYAKVSQALRYRRRIIRGSSGSLSSYSMTEVPRQQDMSNCVWKVPQTLDSDEDTDEFEPLALHEVDNESSNESQAHLLEVMGFPSSKSTEPKISLASLQRLQCVDEIFEKPVPFTRLELLDVLRSSLYTNNESEIFHNNL